jgi:hypothetical protein
VPAALWLLPAALVANAVVVAAIAWRFRHSPTGLWAGRWLGLLVATHLVVAALIAFVLVRG